MDKRLGLASYSGREGRTHYFSVALEDGSTKFLAVPALRACITADRKQAPRNRMAVAAAGASKVERMPRKPRTKEARAYLERVMTGLHEASKSEAVVRAAEGNDVGNGGASSTH